MNKRIKWIEHKEKPILFVDFSELSDEMEIISVIHNAEKVIKNYGQKDILYLMDIKNSKGSPAIIEEYNKFSKNIKDLVMKDAVIGASGIHNVLLQGIRLFSGITLKSFKTKEEAITYLVS